MRGLPLLLLSLLLSSLASQALAEVRITRSAGETRFDVSVDDVTLTKIKIGGRTWTQARLKGVEGYEGVRFVEGRPDVPVIRFLVDDAMDIRVEAAAASTLSVLASGVDLVPVQPSLLKIRGSMRTFKLDVQSYEKPGLYPSTSWSVEDAGSVNGNARKLITLYPVAYDPVTRQLVLRKTFEIRATLVHGQGALKSKAMAFVVGAKFKSSPALAKYVQFKRSQGYLVQKILLGAKLNDKTPDLIRAQIQKLYRRPVGLDHVILVGDAEDVPGHPSTFIKGTTDHYYRAIDTKNYLDDINGPDVAVGRFSAGNEADLSAMVEKSIRYARGKFGQRGWLNGASWLATDDRYQVAEASHNYVINTYSSAMGYRGIFPSNPQAGGDKLYAVTYHVPHEQVLRSLSDGRTMIQYSGHGATTYWDAPRVEQSDVRAFKDPDALPFVIANACVTGDFRVGESFAETWSRHPNGAILYWGSMDSTYWDEDDILERRQADGMFRDHLVRFADITEHALSQLWAAYGGANNCKYYWETYTTFGDPSLEYRDAASR